MAHTQLHTVNDVNNHSGVPSATQGNFVTFDSNGLPSDAEDLAPSDLTMQYAYDNGSGLTFSENMTWDLNEAYDFILQEGADNVTVQATAADAISFSALVNVIDFDTATTLDMTAGGNMTLNVLNGSTLTLDAQGGSKPTIALTSGYDVNIQPENAFNVGTASNLNTAQIVCNTASNGYASVSLDCNSTNVSQAQLYATTSVAGVDSIIQLLATNTGGASGDDAQIILLPTGSASSEGHLYLGRNVGGTNFADKTWLESDSTLWIESNSDKVNVIGATEVELRSPGTINIGSQIASCTINIGRSVSGSDIRFVDANHAGALPAWTQGYIPLSDGIADWNGYKTNFGEVSLMTAINAAFTGSTLWTTSGSTNLTPSTAGYGLDIDATGTSTIELNAAAASHFIVAGAGLTLSTTTSGDIDISSAANLDLDGATVDINSTGALTIGDDTATLDFDGAGAVSETGMTSFSITPSGAITFTAGATSTWSTSAGDLNISAAADLDLDGATVNINSTGTLAIGDDTATLDFDGAGAVSETGMTSFSITPSGAFTFTGGAASSISTGLGDLDISAAANLDLDGATVNINSTGTLAIGDDTATLDFDGSGAVSETGMTSFTISPSGAIALTSGDTSNLSMNANNAADRTLTIAATNAGAGDGLIDIQADSLTLGNASATTISVNSNKITNLAAGTASTDAVNKSQLDAAVGGVSWQEPAAVLKIKSDADQSGVDPTALGAGEAWLVNNWATKTDGDIVEWSGSAWVTVVANSGGEPPDGTRVVVIGSGAGGSFTGQEDDIGQYSTSGSSWSFTTAANGMGILISGGSGVYENQAYTYDDTPGTWIQFAGPNLYTAGSGIDISSNVVSLGALTGDWAAGNYNITGLAYVEMDELKLGVVAQAAMPTPTSGTATFWRDTDDSNKIYLVFNDPTTGVVAVEMT